MDRVLNDKNTGAVPGSRHAAANTFVTYARKMYHPLGFHKGYNFPLFVILCGAMWGFFFARAQYFNINGVFMKNAIPGEQYYYRAGHGRVGIILHLVTILPATFLVVFQFIPIIRYRAMIFHRINGYLCITLLLLANVGAFMLCRHAVGGDPQTQTWIGVLGAMITGALFLAYVNIKALQIDQHRAWMLRAWVWAASIISLRLIMMAANKVIENWYTYYTPISCSQIFFMYQYIAGIPDRQNPTNLIYPQCNTSSSAYVAVTTRPLGRAGPEHAAAMFHVTFGLSGWMATIIHAILLEVYLALTPAESARLRMVSYERQVKAGLINPNKGAITATRFGDAPPTWNSPMMQEKFGSSDTSAQTLQPNDTEILPRKKEVVVGDTV